MPRLTSTSPTSKSVTSSEKVNLARKSAVELIFSGTPLIATVGASESYCELAVAAALALPAASSAAPWATDTVTSPFALGVITAVQTVPGASSLSLKFEAPPLVTWMSPAAKPVTASVKVNVAVNATVLVGGTPLIVTVGAVLSHFAVATSSTNGPVFKPASVAASAITVTVTSSPSFGVTTSMNSVKFPTPVKSLFVPPDTVTSSVSKSVTASEKVNVAVKAFVEVIHSSIPIVTVGALGSYSELASAVAPLSLPARSWAAPAASDTVTLPAAVGVISAVHFSPLVTSVNSEALPLVTWMSVVSKPVTVSSKMNVAVNAELLDAGTSPIVTVGAVLSHCAVLLTASAGPVFSAPSAAAFCFTVTVTSFEPSGVTTSA